MIVACDGAINNLITLALVPDYIIGDGDSVGVIPPSAAKNPYIYIGDQNTNDLTKAINLLAQKFPATSAVVIFGASGLREDHSLANIALLRQYSLIFPKIVMLSDYGVFRVCPAGTSYLPSYNGQQLSFFSCASTTQISCPNLKWPLVAMQFNHLNSGTLNQATAPQLTLETTAPILVYQAFEIRS